jgi:hypothetical protein
MAGDCFAWIFQVRSFFEGGDLGRGSWSTQVFGIFTAHKLVGCKDTIFVSANREAPGEGPRGRSKKEIPKKGLGQRAI